MCRRARGAIIVRSNADEADLGRSRREVDRPGDLRHTGVRPERWPVGPADHVHRRRSRGYRRRPQQQPRRRPAAAPAPRTAPARTRSPRKNAPYAHHSESGRGMTARWPSAAPTATAARPRSTATSRRWTRPRRSWGRRRRTRAAGDPGRRRDLSEPAPAGWRPGAALIGSSPPSPDLELDHHVVVLVDEVVAVHHVPAALVLEAHDHADLLVLADVDDVLRALLVGSRRPAVAVEDLEVDEVDVDRVEPAAARVLELPDLDVARARVGRRVSRSRC